MAMKRRIFLGAFAGALFGLAVLRRLRAARAAADDGELVLVNGWIVKRSQAPKGTWKPAP
jgi:hypothetical protein